MDSKDLEDQILAFAAQHQTVGLIVVAVIMVLRLLPVLYFRHLMSHRVSPFSFLGNVAYFGICLWLLAIFAFAPKML